MPLFLPLIAAAFSAPPSPAELTGVQLYSAAIVDAFERGDLEWLDKNLSPPSLKFVEPGRVELHHTDGFLMMLGAFSLRDDGGALYAVCPDREVAIQWTWQGPDRALTNLDSLRHDCTLSEGPAEAFTALPRSWREYGDARQAELGAWGG